QNQAIGDHDDSIGLAVRKLALRRFVAKGARRSDRDAALLGHTMDRGAALGMAPPRRARRLSVDAADLVPRLQKRFEGRHRKLGRAHEDEAQSLHRLSSRRQLALLLQLAQDHVALDRRQVVEIGRASWRGRVWSWVL